MNHRPRPPLGSPPPFSSPLALRCDEVNGSSQESYGNVIVYQHPPIKSCSKPVSKLASQCSSLFPTTKSEAWSTGAQPILDTLYFSSCSDLLSIATDWLALFPGAIPTRLRPHGLALAHNALALLLRLVYGLSQDWCCGARRKGPA
jgi:hypothetical protein